MEAKRIPEHVLDAYLDKHEPKGVKGTSGWMSAISRGNVFHYSSMDKKAFEAALDALAAKMDRELMFSKPKTKKKKVGKKKVTRTRNGHIPKKGGVNPTEYKSKVRGR